MSEPNWELKDRRMAWMNMNTACSNIISARITAGLFKPKNNTEAMKELLDAIGIEYSAYLTIGVDGKPESSKKEESASKAMKKASLPFVCMKCQKGVSEKVKAYSEENFNGEVYCFDCQNEIRRRIEEATGPSDIIH